MFDNKPIMYGQFTKSFLDSLAIQLQNKRVLEVFAGNGFLASELVKRGVDLHATSLFAGHDGHDFGMYHDVEEMEASEAVRTYGAASDILLMSWPTSTNAAAKAILEWGHVKPIYYIGEMTNYEKGHLGGCASDVFFEMTDIEESIPPYETRNIMEHAVVLRAKNNSLQIFKEGLLNESKYFSPMR
jgi:hypothetical protein